MESNTQQTTTPTTANHDGQAPNVTFDDPVLSGLTPEQREAVEKLIKEKSTQLFEQQMKQETKTKVKPPTTKAGGSSSLPLTKPAEKVKPATGDASVKSADRTPTAAAAGKKVQIQPPTAAAKPEESKKEEEKQSAAEKKREEAEKKK